MAVKTVDFEDLGLTEKEMEVIAAGAAKFMAEPSDEDPEPLVTKRPQKGTV